MIALTMKNVPNKKFSCYQSDFNTALRKVEVYNEIISSFDKIYPTSEKK